MFKIPKPIYDIEKLIDECIEKKEKVDETGNIVEVPDDFRDRIRKVKKTIIEQSNSYDEKAEKSLLYTICPHDTIDDIVDKNDMKYIYDKRFVQRKKCRDIYDKIMLATPFKLCSYCAEREASTLDHYLPKSIYISYSITPYNLLPSCMPCNQGKSTAVFLNEEDMSIHPYYDDFTDEIWIKATVIEGDPIAFCFDVAPPTSWEKIKKERAINHFKDYHLDKVYGAHSGRVITTCVNEMKRVFKKGGRDAAIERLEEKIEDEFCICKNSWKAAMYQSLINNSWFWDTYMPSVILK